MAQELPSITQACEAFILSLNEGRYYDAHEAIEVLWFPLRFEDNEEVKLWKGFINAAVCFELIKKRRFKASETAWNTYLKYRPLLKKVTSKHCSTYVKIDKLIQNRRISCPNS